MKLITIIFLTTLILLTGCSSSPKVPANDEPQHEIIQEEKIQEQPAEETAPIEIAKTPKDLGDELLNSIIEFYYTGNNLKNGGSQNEKNNYLTLNTKINSLLEDGADVNQKNSQGNSPISVAVANKDTTMVSKLLKKGANANETTPEGYGLLTTAIDNEDSETAMVLIKNGANVDGNDESNTPLANSAIKALNNGNFNRVGNQLLSNNANPNVMMKNQIPVLLYTIKTKNTELAKSLIKSGAELDYVEENISMVNWAILLKENSTAKAMINKDKTILKNENTFSPLGWASLVNNKEMYDFLKENKVTVKEDEKGWVALELEKMLTGKEIASIINGEGVSNDPVVLPLVDISPDSKINKIPLKNMKFLSIDYNNNYAKIYTEDEIRREMTLKNPTRIVFDFNRLSGVKNFTKNFNNEYLKKVAVGRHEGWYRVVLYMKKGLKYNTIIEQDGIKIIYK
ncbi:MAG: AMIN domain-containing protein [Campylobacterales bacterium]|nr:AMIN domain-containing protein [Campylobacterales bacterium]